jgi:hypothetical protein
VDGLFISQSHPSPITGEVIRRIVALYAIEAQIRGKPPDRRREICMAQTQPLLDDMHRWLTGLLSTQSANAHCAQFHQAEKISCSSAQTRAVSGLQRCTA